jgi:hypothetical protein
MPLMAHGEQSAINFIILLFYFYLHCTVPIQFVYEDTC